MVSRSLAIGLRALLTPFMFLCFSSAEMSELKVIAEIPEPPIFLCGEVVRCEVSVLLMDSKTTWYRPYLFLISFLSALIHVLLQENPEH